MRARWNAFSDANTQCVSHFARKYRPASGQCVSTRCQCFPTSSGQPWREAVDVWLGQSEPRLHVGACEPVSRDSIDLVSVRRKLLSTHDWRRPWYDDGADGGEKLVAELAEEHGCVHFEQRREQSRPSIVPDGVRTVEVFRPQPPPPSGSRAVRMLDYSPVPGADQREDLVPSDAIGSP